MSVDVQKNLEEKISKSIDVLKEKLNSVRAGRANPALLDQVQAECYGSTMPIKCHRSYLVNLAHISRLSKTEVILDGGKRLPLSRGAARQVHRAFVLYYTGGSHEAF